MKKTMGILLGYGDPNCSTCNGEKMRILLGLSEKPPGMTPDGVGLPNILVKVGPDGVGKIMGDENLPPEFKNALDQIMGAMGLGEKPPAGTFDSEDIKAGRTNALEVMTNTKGGIKITQIIKCRMNSWTIATRNVVGAKFLVTSELTVEKKAADLNPDMGNAMGVLATAMREYNSKIKRIEELRESFQGNNEKMCQDWNQLLADVQAAFPNIVPHGFSGFTIEKLDSEINFLINGIEVNATAAPFFDRQQAILTAEERINANENELTTLEKKLVETSGDVSLKKRLFWNVVKSLHPDLKVIDFSPGEEGGEEPYLLVRKKTEEQVDTLPSNLQKMVAGAFALQPDLFSDELATALGLIATPTT